MKTWKDYPKQELISQHKERLNYMPWLYFKLKAKHKAWAQPWQIQLQEKLQAFETIELAENCFIADSARLFAEPGRGITMAKHCFVGAQAFLHGPIVLEENVGINHACSFDGGQAGIVIGANTRIAAGVKIYAFNHGMAPNALIDEQPVTSKGIKIGRDVWIGTNVSISDGVKIADHAVVGMGAVVVKDVPAHAIVAGNPARVIGDRRDKAAYHRPD